MSCNYSLSLQNMDENSINIKISNLDNDKINKIICILNEGSCPFKLGEILNYFGEVWDIVHIDNYTRTMVLALHTIPFNIVFGKNANYDSSYLKKMCEIYKKWIGAIGELFIPTIEEIGSYDWFKDIANRKCKDAVSYDSSWWTSSSSGTNSVYFVSSSGGVNGSGYDFSFGFRPFIKINY